MKGKISDQHSFSLFSSTLLPRERGQLFSKSFVSRGLSATEHVSRHPSHRLCVVSPSLSHQQNGNVPQHGCSHGFHTTLYTESCSGTGVSVLRCSSMALPIFLITVSKRGSVSGDRGLASEGSRERSKSNGGSWWVTPSPKHGQNPLS